MQNIENFDPKLTTSPDPVADPAAPGTPRRTRTMSPAALAANRANAQKSSGPRTPAGKARSASNNFRHSLYAVDAHLQFSHSADVGLAVAHNYLEQFQPITPTEHIMLNNIVTLHLRILQFEALYAREMNLVAAGSDSRSLPFFSRELNLMPARLNKAIKALREEIHLRDSQSPADQSPDPIEDFPNLPPLNRPSPLPQDPANPDSQSKEKLGTKPNPVSPYLAEYLHFFSLNYGQPTPTTPANQPTNPHNLPFPSSELDAAEDTESGPELDPDA